MRCRNEIPTYCNLKYLITLISIVFFIDIAIMHAQEKINRGAEVSDMIQPNVIAQIKGKVVENLYDIPLPGAYVSIKNSKLGVYVNPDGDFVLDIPTESIHENLEIVIEHIGFEDKVLKVKNYKDFILVKMEEESWRGTECGVWKVKKKKRFWLF